MDVMSEGKLVRPPQVTLAGWLVVAGSVVVVLMAFDQVSTLRSLENREAVEEYLSKPPGNSLGLGVQGALTLMRITAMVAAACAAASAILGWQVLQRSKGARVALSLLAVPLFVSGLIGGGVVSAIVVAAIVMLWFQPARDWFDGIARAPIPRPEPTRDLPTHDLPTHDPPLTRDPLLDLPPPTSPPLHPTPYAAAPVAMALVPSVARRPLPVVWACVLTWLFSAAAFVLLAITLAVMLGAPQTLIDEVYRQNPDIADQGVSDAVLRTTVYVTCAVGMTWSAGAVALAVLAWRRVRWAATGLLVSAGAAGCLCLLVVVGSFVLLLPLIACGATVAFLLRPEARLWFRP